MYPYLLCIALTSLFGHIASRSRGASKCIFTFVAVLPLCLLAALRGPEIGTDVNVYARPVFDLALQGDYATLSSPYYSEWIEPLFRLLAVFVANTTHSFPVFLGLIQALTIGPIAWYLYKETPRAIGLGLVVYSLTLYGFSLNGMRQSIAASILLVVLWLLCRNRYGLSVLATIFAIGFHKMGVVGFFVILVWSIFNGYSSSCRSSLRSVRPSVYASIFLVIFAVVLLLGDDLVAIVSQWKASFAYHDKHRGEGGLSVTALAVAAISVGVYFAVSGCRKKQVAPLLNTLAALVALFGLFSQFSLVSPGLDRVGTFFLVFLAPYVALLASKFENAKSFIYVLIVPSCVFYFVYVYAVGGTGQIMPYSFA